jgi:hypothetical protein
VVPSPPRPSLFIGAGNGEIILAHPCEHDAKTYTDPVSRSDFMQFFDRDASSDADGADGRAPAGRPRGANGGTAMRDGDYDLRFSANGYEGRGSLKMVDDKADGGDHAFRIEGNVFGDGGHISAVFNILIPPRLIGNTGLPEHFSLRMSGITHDRGFNLIGTGPLGVIVDIACTYVAAPPPGQRAG